MLAASPFQHKHTRMFWAWQTLKAAHDYGHLTAMSSSASHPYGNHHNVSRQCKMARAMRRKEI